MLALVSPQLSISLLARVIMEVITVEKKECCHLIPFTITDAKQQVTYHLIDDSQGRRSEADDMLHFRRKSLCCSDNACG